MADITTFPWHWLAGDEYSNARGKLRRAKRVLAFGVADLVGQYREAALHRGVAPRFRHTSV